MTSNSSSKPESFPLIITDDSNDLNGPKSIDQLNDWSDQELDDLFQSPIEEVLDSMRYRTSPKITRKECLKSVLFMSLISFVFGLSFAVIFISGYNSVNINRNISPKFVTKVQSTDNSPDKQIPLNSTPNVFDIRNDLFNNIKAERIAQNYQKLTKKPIVGESGLDDNTLFVYNKWKKLGLKTSFANYSVLLSFQNVDKPNSVNKFLKTGQLVDNSSQFESPLNASEEETKYYGLNQSTIYNVIATIKGCIEPDRYVLVGNHRHAWTFGGADPLSGTAAMIELSEALTRTMKSKDWCPRRTIVFCSWGTDEYGLVGSTEWVKENQKLLQSQAIAYLNVDTAVEGNFTFRGEAVPLLYSALESATKCVENPNPSESEKGLKTVFDSSKQHRPSKMIGSSLDIQPPNSGSGQTSFIFLTGVPIINMLYDCNKTHIKCYPLNHSMYETYDMYSKLTDRGFRYTRAMTQIWAEILRSLSDTPLLPFSDSLKYYPMFLKSAAKELFENKDFKKISNKQNITFEKDLMNAIKGFDQQINEFIENIKNLDQSNDLKLREYNDLMMYLERTFINTEGMPFRSAYKHVLLSPSPNDSYDGSSFASIYYLLNQYIHKTTDSEKSEQLDEIRKHISIIVFHINSAKLLLKQMYN